MQEELQAKDTREEGVMKQTRLLTWCNRLPLPNRNDCEAGFSGVNSSLIVQDEV